MEASQQQRMDEPARQDAPSEHIKLALKPKMIFFVALTHLGGLVGLVLLCLNERWWRLLLEVIVYWQIAGLGITAGAHRLWSHRSYKASSPLRFILMLMNCAAHQGSIYHWCRDHRIHHKFSETDADPHNSQRGMFFAHMGWLLRDKHPQVLKKGGELDLSDLEADWVVTFQAKHYKKLSTLFCYILPGLYGQYVYGDYWLGLFAHGLLHHVVLLHSTWSVNSLAHLYGMRPYDDAIRPVENFFVSLCAVGEGWHNWHHCYPFDYAASEYGILGRYNPTKLFIDACHRIGLVTGRKRAIHLWESKKARLAAASAKRHWPS
ncbi:acyl-CoA desaturase 1-like [Sycon ciliatum]|uniref:acyl-CoA desaturase 1-like n=1 Tax=Sycon ciliatum TaxID=27933 RepID=UPI0020AB10C1|eukprot:scpid81979/ scgid31089/ Stearoyl-CoA desaturase 5; Acyl-CoA-desaturase 4; Stearoyl-CoA 9-desaturase